MKLPADPIAFQRYLWPGVTFYDRQVEVIRSVERNDETFVVAANEMGKDFVAGFVIVWFFLTRHPCRIVCTSGKDDHLDVLFGEATRFIRACKYPLDRERGGPLIVNQREITRWANPAYGQRYAEACAISYVKGMVANEQTEATLGGHHAGGDSSGIPRTMFVADEASSVPDRYWPIVQGWAKRKLVFGNAWSCSNFFRHAFEGVPGGRDRGGDIVAV